MRHALIGVLGLLALALRVQAQPVPSEDKAAVQKKVEGQEITMAEAPPASAQVIDLMEALRASLAKKPPAKGREPQAETRKPPKRAQPDAPAAKKAVKR